jgi:hypothetical protein
MPTTTTLGAFSHAGENITIIGDGEKENDKDNDDEKEPISCSAGCSCVPEFLVSLGSSPAAGRAVAAEEVNWVTRVPSCCSALAILYPGLVQVRNRIDSEIRCKGVPKFNCTFIFESDEFCDRVRLCGTTSPPTASRQVQNMEARQCNHRREVCAAAV